MILEKWNPLQISFVIAAPIVVLGLVIFFILVPLIRKKHKDNFKEYCYKKIYRVAFDEDYYLINNFMFRVDSSKVAKIDHILFANKYIYVIIDAYFDGDLIGNDNDKSLIVINKHNQKSYTDNQYVIVKSLVKYLSVSTGISEDMFIGIVIVNNSCKLGIETDSKTLYMIQRNKFKKLIKAIEMRNIGNINAQQLENAVRAIDKLNRTKRNGQRSTKKGD